jgi:transposase
MGKERERINTGRRQRFTKEFKLEAVRLLELGQKPSAQLALELGIRRNMLHKWQEELRKVTEERDILKKAAAYFAKELK